MEWVRGYAGGQRLGQVTGGEENVDKMLREPPQKTGGEARDGKGDGTGKNRSADCEVVEKPNLRGSGGVRRVRILK